MRKSRTFFAVENLEYPFARVQEKSFMVTHQDHRVSSRFSKIVFVLHGQAMHQFEGQEAQPIGPGDILLVPSPVPQYYRAREHREQIHAISLVFSGLFHGPTHGTFSPSPSGGESGGKMLDFCRQHFRTNSHFHEALDSGLREAAQQLRQEAEQGGPGSRLRISALCQNLTVLCARLREGTAHRGPRPVQGGGSFLVTRAKEYLHSHARGHIRLAEIASSLQVSEEHLARTFRETTGTSVFAYLRTLRLEDAKLRLLNSEQNISEIARASGFSSLALFSRSFKEYTGLSPMEYRREVGGEAPL